MIPENIHPDIVVYEWYNQTRNAIYCTPGRRLAVIITGVAAFLKTNTLNSAHNPLAWELLFGRERMMVNVEIRCAAQRGRIAAEPEQRSIYVWEGDAGPH